MFSEFVNLPTSNGSRSFQLVWLSRLVPGRCVHQFVWGLAVSGELCAPTPVCMSLLKLVCIGMHWVMKGNHIIAGLLCLSLLPFRTLCSSLLLPGSTIVELHLLMGHAADCWCLEGLTCWFDVWRSPTISWHELASFDRCLQCWSA